MSIEWASEYIGLPFEDQGRGPDGWDCWGYFRKLKAEQDGIKLPSYVGMYETIKEKGRVSKAIVRGIDDEWVQVDNVRKGDGVVFRIMGRIYHIGYVLDPPQFLHIHKHINSCMEKWTAKRWNQRIDGFYRHESVMK